MEDAWEGAFEDDISHRRPLDDQVQKTLTFVQEHESVLSNIEQATRNAVSESLDSHYRPIRIISDHTEKVFPQDLVVSSNELLRKVLTVLIFLCDEAHELKEIAETKLFGPLIMFGQTAVEAIDRDDESSTWKSGEREKMIGRFSRTLQDISNFIDRCYSVALNIVQQLSALMKEREQLYKATFQSTHLLPVFSCLGEILTVLITLDCIIQQNEVLQECWSYYKTMISYARGDPATFGTDEAGVTKFERLLVSIDQSVMIGEIFKGCIEQDFESSLDGEEEIRIVVRANQIFISELLYCFKTMLDGAMSVIGTSSELFERYDVVGSLALYALYRRLLPANIPPDAKLHKAIWGVQKSVPFVILRERVVWNCGEFLQTHAALEIKKPDPANPAMYRRTYIQQFDSVLSQRASVLASQVSV